VSLQVAVAGLVPSERPIYNQRAICTKQPTTMSPSDFGFSRSERGQVSICVFCGAGRGNDPAFVQAAEQLAEIFKMNNWALGLVERGEGR
jgi:hypothetical protein